LYGILSGRVSFRIPVMHIRRRLLLPHIFMVNKQAKLPDRTFSITGEDGYGNDTSFLEFLA
jgi:hypothetical protein